MMNMAGNLRSENRLENDIYSFIDVAVLIRRKLKKQENGSFVLIRYVDQIGFFYRENRQNSCILVLDQGEPTGNDFPDVVMKKFEEAHIENPYFYQEESAEEDSETDSDNEVKEYVFRRELKQLAVAEQIAEMKADVESDGVDERTAYVAGLLTDMEDEFIKKKRKGMTFIGRKQKAAFR